MTQSNHKDTDSAGTVMTMREIIEQTTVPTKIIIPKIQRDYAQGRVEEEDVRRKFLDDLFEAFTTGKDRIYDYVYGRLDPVNVFHNKHQEFFPIDGQQRLTTAFLILLYLGKRGEQNVDFLRHFSYETRNSSKLFCEFLMNTPSGEFADIITYIRDHPEFTSEWENDPTISSMVTMLGDIHSRYSDSPLLQGLEKEKVKEVFQAHFDNFLTKIKFWVLNIKDLESTDDLYIKMNSRGLPLTPFENFKAELDNFISTNYKSQFQPGEFSKDVDTKWTQLFWGYRDRNLDFVEVDLKDASKSNYTSNGLDDKMLNFFRNYLIMEGLRTGVLATSGGASQMDTMKLAAKVHEKSPGVFADIRDILNFFSNIVEQKVKFVGSNEEDTEGRLEDWFSRFLTATPEEVRFRETPLNEDYRVCVSVGVSNEIDLFEVLMMPEGDVTRMQRLFCYGFLQIILLHYRNERRISTENVTIPEIHNLGQYTDRLRILRNLIANSEIHDNAMQSNLADTALLIEKGITPLLSTRSEYSGLQKKQEVAKLYWSRLPEVSAEEVRLMKQLENMSVLRGNLYQLYAESPLTKVKMENFRNLFASGVEYDEIEQIALSFGDYGLKSGSGAVGYGVRSVAGWRDSFFTNTKSDFTPVLESMITGGSYGLKDYLRHLRLFRINSRVNKKYDWPYYLGSYKSMRWAPNGWYLLEGLRYKYYMFRASSCYHTGGYVHYNVYNDALFCRYFRNVSTEDDRGGALRFSGYNFSIDYAESSIRVIMDEKLSHIVRIPQDADGYDMVDRIVFGAELVKKLMRKGGEELKVKS